MALKVFDGGDYLIVGADSREEVEAKLATYEARGAKVISGAAAIGSHWAAACTLRGMNAADTTMVGPDW